MLLFVVLFIANLVRTIFIIAIVYFGFRFLFRILAPLLLNKGMKNMQERMQQQQRPTKRPEGEVTIESQPQNSATSQSDDVEYIDFEEVD